MKKDNKETLRRLVYIMPAMFCLLLLTMVYVLAIAQIDNSSVFAETILTSFFAVTGYNMCIGLTTKISHLFENIPREQIETYKLVQELQERKGVNSAIVGRYEDKSLQVEGPAIVLVIVD